MKVVTVATAALLTGCVVSSPITQTAGDNYRVDSRVHLCSWCDAEARSLKMANTFCAKTGRTAEVTQGHGMNYGGNQVTDTTFFTCIPKPPADGYN